MNHHYFKFFLEKTFQLPDVLMKLVLIKKWISNEKVVFILTSGSYKFIFVLYAMKYKLNGNPADVQRMRFGRS